MKNTILLIGLSFLLWQKQINADVPKVTLDNKSKIVESNLYFKENGKDKLTYSASYSRYSKDDYQCEIGAISKDCGIPYVTLKMDLDLSKELYANMKKETMLGFISSVDDNTSVKGKNFNIAPKSVVFTSSDKSNHCAGTGGITDSFLHDFDLIMAKANNTSIEYERRKRIAECFDNNRGRFSETIYITLHLDDLRKLLVSNYMEINVFDDQYVLPWQAIRDLKLFYDEVNKIHNADYAESKPSNPSPFADNVEIIDY